MRLGADKNLPGATILILAFVLGVGAQTASSVIAIRGATLIDVVSGRSRPNTTVIIDGNRITQVGRNLRIQKHAEQVDGAGKFLIPGLWDMHVHTTDDSYFGLFVANGVTGTRDMGGAAIDANDGCESVLPLTLIVWRTNIRSGKGIGPRMLMSGPAVSNTGSPTSITVRTPGDAQEAVATLKALEVDFIKVYEKIPQDAYLALAREAKSANLTIAGHVPADTVSLLDAVRAGQRSIEHIRDPLLMCFTENRTELLRFFRQDGWAKSDVDWGLDQFGRCPQLIKELRRNDTWLVPTLTVERAKVAVEDPTYVNDSRRALLPQSVQDGLRDFVKKKQAQPAAERNSEHLWWSTQKRLVGRMHRGGIKFLAGTDSACEGGLPGFSLHEELRLLVEAGFTPLEALRTATINPAKFVGRENHLGTIEAGKLADLVLLNANPLKDISNTRKIDAVVANGRLLRREELDSMLRNISGRNP